MRRLLPILLLTVAVRLGSAGEVLSGEPDERQFCALGTAHSHAAIKGRCSAAYESGDYPTALREWRNLAKQGHARAKKNLKIVEKRIARSKSADLQKVSDAVQRGDFATALRVAIPLAEQGDAAAQALLGALYAEGKGIGADNEYGQGGYEQESLPDYESAAKWFRLAAEQEVAAAQLYLGWMYHQGKGVEQNYKETLKWLGLAAKQWSPVEKGRAQTLLGVMYAEGQGVTKNYETVLKFFRLAAEHDRAAAQYALGIMNHKGQGVPQDYATAEKWYKRAIAPRSVSTPNFSDTFETNVQAQAKNNLRILKQEIAKLKKQTKNKKGNFLSLEELKNKCSELGFTKGTEKHGDCVMKLYK